MNHTFIMETLIFQLFEGPDNKDDAKVALLPSDIRVYTTAVKWFPTVCRDRICTRLDVLGC